MIEENLDESPIEENLDESPEPTDSPADGELANRLWLKSAVLILQARSHDSDPSDRVQFAVDMMAVAVCERIARICRSDLPAEHA